MPNREADFTLENEKWAFENEKIEQKLLGFILESGIYSQEFARSLEL